MQHSSLAPNFTLRIFNETPPRHHWLHCRIHAGSPSLDDAWIASRAFLICFACFTFVYLVTSESESQPQFLSWIGDKNLDKQHYSTHRDTRTTEVSVRICRTEFIGYELICEFSSFMWLKCCVPSTSQNKAASWQSCHLFCRTAQNQCFTPQTEIKQARQLQGSPPRLRSQVLQVDLELLGMRPQRLSCFQSTPVIWFVELVYVCSEQKIPTSNTDLPAALSSERISWPSPKITVASYKCQGLRLCLPYPTTSQYNPLLSWTSIF